MSCVPGFAFSCDSPDGCLAHATVAAYTSTEARVSLSEALGWYTSDLGDLCPDHARQRPV